MCSSAPCTVLPCGSTTAFFGVMMIFAFIAATFASAKCAARRPGLREISWRHVVLIWRYALKHRSQETIVPTKLNGFNYSHAPSGGLRRDAVTLHSLLIFRGVDLCKKLYSCRNAGLSRSRGFVGCAARRDWRARPQNLDAIQASCTNENCGGDVLS